jgi:hypothetical protein
MDVYSDKINISFRKASILVAVVTFLFLTPIFIVIIIRANNKKKIWAPMVSKCPDYWTISKNAENQIKCTPGTANSKNVLNPNGFYTYQFPTKQNKYEYAIKNGVEWDGITNDESLIKGVPDKQNKTIFWLLGKLFLNDVPPYHKTQDPNYLHNINDVNNGINNVIANNRNAKPGNNNYNLLDSLTPKK